MQPGQKEPCISVHKLHWCTTLHYITIQHLPHRIDVWSEFMWVGVVVMAGNIFSALCVGGDDGGNYGFAQTSIQSIDLTSIRYSTSHILCQVT